MTILQQARALEALATIQSKTAIEAPKCHPETRKEIVQDIVRRVRGSKGGVIWFSGPAGGGKTCVMREIARKVMITTY